MRLRVDGEMSAVLASTDPGLGLPGLDWETNTPLVPSDQHRARCGHLYVRVLQLDESTGGECEWFVESDDEESYRRALANGCALTVDAAKQAALSACEEVVAAMLRSLSSATPEGSVRERDCEDHSFPVDFSP